MVKENFKLIATRVPPSDRWALVDDPNQVIYSPLTEVLEAYFKETEYEGDYKLCPLEGKIYIIEHTEQEPKKYNVFGEFNFKQGS